MTDYTPDAAKALAQRLAITDDELEALLDASIPATDLDAIENFIVGMRNEQVVYDVGYEAHLASMQEQYFSDQQIVPNRFTYIKASDAKPNLESNDFVQGLLEDGKLSVLYGPSNCGKTFFATDLCLHVSLGWPWRGKRVEQRNVMYVAMEGASGLQNRLSAFKQRHNIAEVNQFLFVPHTIDLLDPEADIPEFIRLIEQAAADIGEVRWIVIDTLARAIAGGDENSGEDMGRLIRHADKLQKLPSTPHVTLIHHSGKDAAKGARGWSGLRAAIDTEIEIMRSEDQKYSTVKDVKQRDLPMQLDAAFILEPQVLGLNRHGEQVISCTVHEWDAPVRDKSEKKERKLNPVHKFVYDTIVKLSESFERISYEQLRDELDAAGFKEMYNKKGEPREIKTMTYNARVGLRDRGLIDFDGETTWLV